MKYFVIIHRRLNKNWNFLSYYENMTEVNSLKNIVVIGTYDKNKILNWIWKENGLVKDDVYKKRKYKLKYKEKRGILFWKKIIGHYFEI